MPTEAIPPLPAITRVEILKATRDRIAAGWCQQVAATDEQGIPHSPYGAQARRFCLVGAIAAAVDALAGDETDQVFARIAFETQLLDQKIGTAADWRELTRPIARWNDDPSRTQAEVVAFLDDAIADLK